jgi:hypothetical protein
MTAQVRVGGAWEPLTGCQVYANGAWRNISKIQVYSGGAWRLVANFIPPMGGVTISPSFIFKSSRTSPSITSGTITATPSGGTAPYTYAWTVVSSSPTTVSITSPGLASTTVTADASSGEVDCTLRCTVTDAVGSSVSADVDGTFTYTPGGFGGGGGPIP